MKGLILFFGLVILLSSCSEPKSDVYTVSEIRLNGEFLFEGPNTLQSDASLGLDEIAATLEISSDDIKNIYLSECTIQIMPDSLRESIESVLLQMLSDNTEMKSIATLNPLPTDGILQLNLASDEDLKGYFGDSGAIYVLDANLSGEMEELNVILSLKFNVVH